MFAHPVMLAGVCGAVIPLLIHLLNRARYRSVLWGAMMFLTDQSSERQSLAWRRPLALLLFRMLIVAALAVLLARPLIGEPAGNSRSSQTDRRLCVVILFDNSAGMAFDEGSAGKRIETARRATLAIATGLGRDDEVHFIPMSINDVTSPNVSSAPSDLQSAVADIAEVQPSDRAADIAAGLKVASRVFAQSEVRQKIILLVASRQATNWRNVTDLFIATFREQTLNAGTDLRAIFMPIGGIGNNNVAIDRLVVSPTPAVSGVAEPVQIQIHNYGKSDVNQLPIELRVIGQRSDQRFAVDIPAGEHVDVTRSVIFPSNGPHILFARIRDAARTPGGITFDDQAEAVVEADNPTKVLVIDEGSPATSPASTLPSASTRTQADIVSTALAPLRRSDESCVDPFVVTHASADSEWANDLDPFRAIILCGTLGFDSKTQAALDGFVNAGGGLVFLPGRASRGFSSTETTSRADAPPIFSADFGPKKTVIDGRIHLTALGSRGLFPAGSTGTALDQVRLSTFAPIVEPPPRAGVLIQTNDRQPLLIVQTVGAGRVATCGIPMGVGDPVANSSAIVPLMQSLVRFVAGGAATHRNLQPGEPIKFSSVDPRVSHAAVTLPDGTRQNANVVDEKNRADVTFTNTHQPGRYLLSVRETGGENAVPFIVRAFRDGSDLTPIADQQLDRVINLLGMRKVSTNEPTAVIDEMQRVRTPDYWPWSVFALVFALVLELWLSNRLVAVGRVGRNSMAKVA